MTAWLQNLVAEVDLIKLFEALAAENLSILSIIQEESKRRRKELFILKKNGRIFKMKKKKGRTNQSMFGEPINLNVCESILMKTI